MAWGWSFAGGGRRKKPKKEYHNWFERLSSAQLKELLASAKLPISGSNAARIARLLECPHTAGYQYEATKVYHGHITGKAMTTTDLQAQCREANLPVSGSKYELVLRLIQHQCGDKSGNSNTSKKRSASDDSHGEPAGKKARILPVLEGEALAKRVTFRRQKLNKAIDTRLAWKSSMRGMDGTVVMGARVEIECPEPEVFVAMFGSDDMKKNGSKMTKIFRSDDDIEDAGLEGKTYRYGAVAYLKAPASATLSNGKVSFSFKYTVRS